MQRERDQIESQRPAVSPEPQLHIRLLGSPEITLNGKRLKSVESCHRAALIIYLLALHPGGLSIDRLGAMLTTDSAYIDAFDTDAAMRAGTVRTFIWRVRKVSGWRGILGASSKRGTQQTTYRLPDNTQCDLWEFETVLDQAARLVLRADIEPGADDRAAMLRQEAILLYRGEFCKGIGSGSIVRAAEYLRQRYLETLLQQAAYWKSKALHRNTIRNQPDVHKNSQGRKSKGRLPVREERAWLEALRNYRLACQAEPCDESAYVGAMLCQAHLGNPDGVQKTLLHCSRVLDSQLDRTPLPATLRMARECIRLASATTSHLAADQPIPTFMANNW